MERDERPLAEINFAMDESDPATRERVQAETRIAFSLVGVKVAQDIVDLGCTGLAGKMGLRGAQVLRKNMSGSICGLPCYVPPDRFCLIHNTIGGLQLQGNVDGVQQNPHPEGVALCSRELNDEEKKHAAVMQSKIDEHARKLTGEADPADTSAPPEPAIRFVEQRNYHCAITFHDGFQCPEHTAPEWRCRFCLAAAIIAGDFEPQTMARLIDDRGVGAFAPGGTLGETLADDHYTSVELYVRAAIWRRKMVREE
jgi:hypothetical protein